MKPCTRCGTEYPATLEHFPPNKSGKDGLDPVCRPCRRAYAKTWKAQNAERLLTRRRALYAERHAASQREKHQARLTAIPLRMRAQLLRQGMSDRSKRRGIPFAADVLTISFLMDWIQRTPTCPCCGQPIDYGYKGKGPQPNSPSIDRFSPSLGYVPGNVALICWRCNNLKRDATADELEAIARWMRAHPLSPSR